MDHFSEEKEINHTQQITATKEHASVNDSLEANGSHVEGPRFVKLRKWQLAFGAILLAAFSVVTTLVFAVHKDMDFSTLGSVVPRPTVEISKDMEELETVYRQLINRYFQEVDSEKLVNGAITGMVNALDDPFSSYLVGEESSHLNEMITGEFSGIGAIIGEKDGTIFVDSPMKGLPAEKAGLKIGDVIVSVDGVSMVGKTSSEAVKMIRGEKGTKVVLEIKRAGKEGATKVTITRDTIPISSVDAEMLDGNIAHININTFSTETDQEMKEKLTEMEAEGMQSLILDMRSNPGGVMESALKIANFFVPEGKVIMQREGRDGQKEVSYADANDGYKVSIPVVVLINGESASASEIVAAALQESANVQVIGTESYGKGTVQATLPMSNESMLKLTVSKWLTPDGNWIHEDGVRPDVVVEMPAYASLFYLNPKETLKRGVYSTEILNAEKVIEALGFNPGNIDGYYDADTVSAVRAFQTENQLKVSGEIDSDTASKMMELLRKMIDENDLQLQAAKKELSK